MGTCRIITKQSDTLYTVSLTYVTNFASAELSRVTTKIKNSQDTTSIAYQILLLQQRNLSAITTASNQITTITAVNASQVYEIGTEYATLEINGNIDEAVLGPSDFPLISVIQHPLATSPEAWYTNIAIYDGWQRHRPTYRKAVVTQSVNGRHSIRLYDASSKFVNKNINEYTFRNNVPSTDNSTLPVDQEVVVCFLQQDWNRPVIIAADFAGFTGIPIVGHMPRVNYYLNSGSVAATPDTDGFAIESDSTTVAITVTNSVAVLPSVSVRNTRSSFSTAIGEKSYEAVGCDVTVNGSKVAITDVESTYTGPGQFGSTILTIVTTEEDAVFATVTFYYRYTTIIPVVLPSELPDSATIPTSQSIPATTLFKTNFRDATGSTHYERWSLEQFQSWLPFQEAVYSPQYTMTLNRLTNTISVTFDPNIGSAGLLWQEYRHMEDNIIPLFPVGLGGSTLATVKMSHRYPAVADFIGSGKMLNKEFHDLSAASPASSFSHAVTTGLSGDVVQFTVDKTVTYTLIDTNKNIDSCAISFSGTSILVVAVVDGVPETILNIDTLIVWERMIITYITSEPNFAFFTQDSFSTPYFLSGNAQLSADGTTPNNICKIFGIADFTDIPE